MSDLISRKALLAKVVEANPMGGMIGGKFVEDLIKGEPTAYDVDKVMEQLEKRKCSKLDAKEDPSCHARNRHIDMCIRVVKGAVKDEQ